MERKRKTDRDLYDAEVVEVDTTRKQLKNSFRGIQSRILRRADLQRVEEY